MATDISDTNRWLRIKCPSLGDGQLILTGFSGEEAISSLFTFRLDLLSPRAKITPSDMLGKDITFSVGGVEGGALRHFSGVVSRLAATGQVARSDRTEYYTYHAEVVPHLWLLTHRIDCRIFQNMTTADIVKKVLADAGHKAPKKIPVGRTWEYCVQYLETDFAFISRLLEEEGWYYFLQHGEGTLDLMIAEDAGAYFALTPDTVILVAGTPGNTSIGAWDQENRFLPGKWSHKDYDFKAPSKDLLVQTNTVVPMTGQTKYEVFDFPGNYIDKGNAAGKGDMIAKRRLEAIEANWELAEGHGGCSAMAPGGTFKMKGHYFQADDEREWVCARVRHSGAGVGYVAGDTGGDTYSNSFVVAPRATILRPSRNTPRPIIAGPQTAVVTGVSGEEIDVDEYGRIHVQFFWDRVGVKNEKSSCWIRVAQLWAGATWGAMFTPRIGMEVIVDFLDGDPDRPMVTGCVYNATNMPPWALPANKTQSGIETRSTKTGAKANTNILRFEDLKGKEWIYTHAERNKKVEVERNDLNDIGRNRITNIHKNDHITIDKNQEITIKNDQVETITMDRTQTIKTGNDTYELGTGNRKETIKTGNDTFEMSMGNQTNTWKLGNRTTKFSLGKDETQAMQSIELKVGGSSIKLDPMSITIKSMMIKIEGSIMVEMKGLMTTVKGDAMLTLKGGITMIN